MFKRFTNDILILGIRRGGPRQGGQNRRQPKTEMTVDELNGIYLFFYLNFFFIIYILQLNWMLTQCKDKLFLRVFNYER